jgi:subtilase family serine protease
LVITGRIARRMVLFTFVALIAGTALAGPASAAPAGLALWHDRSATKVGALPTRPLAITLTLAPRDAAGLKALVARPHTALTPGQFNARYAPSRATVKAIRAWAATSKLRVASVSANRLLVKLTGSSTAVGSALHTGFARFSSARDGNFYAPTRAARLPKALAPRVAAVLGLSSLAKLNVPHPAVRSAASLNKVLSTLPTSLTKLGLAAPSLAYPSQYTPQQFWSMYDAPAAQTGSGQQLAIITEGDVSQPKQDLATFESKFGLPSVAWNQINVGAPSTDTSGADEWDLDSQYSTGFAPGVGTLDVYVGPSLDNADILTTINRWVTDDAARQGSFSAGECDLLAYAAGFSTGLDTVLQQAAAQGQTMFFSSGDTGSQCPAVTGVNGVPAGIPDTSYPASSPYGIGVGGTSVLSPSGPTEIGWYAGGGGFSPLEPKAAFQSATKVYGVAASPLRAVPDVSLDADPESGYEVIVAGAEETIGGTSASAPSWQGIWARAQGAHGGALGFAGPVLYSTVPATAFHDVQIGSNVLYPAGPGFDLVTGLGTPDIAKLISGA